MSEEPPGDDPIGIALRVGRAIEAAGGAYLATWAAHLGLTEALEQAWTDSAR